MDSPRWKFIKSALNDIDEQLKKLGSRLHVLSGQPSEQLPVIFDQWNIVRLGFSSHPGCNESVSETAPSLAWPCVTESRWCTARPRTVCTHLAMSSKPATDRCPSLLAPFAPPTNHATTTKPVSVPDSEIMNSLSDDHDEIEKNAFLMEKDDKEFCSGETEAGVVWSSHGGL